MLPVIQFDYDYEPSFYYETKRFQYYFQAYELQVRFFSWRYSIVTSLDTKRSPFRKNPIVIKTISYRHNLEIFDNEHIIPYVYDHKIIISEQKTGG